MQRPCEGEFAKSGGCGGLGRTSKAYSFWTAWTGVANCLSWLSAAGPCGWEEEQRWQGQRECWAVRLMRRKMDLLVAVMAVGKSRQIGNVSHDEYHSTATHSRFRPRSFSMAITTSVQRAHRAAFQRRSGSVGLAVSPSTNTSLSLRYTYPPTAPTGLTVYPQRCERLDLHYQCQCFSVSRQSSPAQSSIRSPLEASVSITSFPHRVPNLIYISAFPVQLDTGSSGKSSVPRPSSLTVLAS